MNAIEITDKIFEYIQSIDSQKRKNRENDTDNSDEISGIDRKRLVRIIGSLVSGHYYSLGGSKAELAEVLWNRLSMNGWDDKDIGIVLQNNYNFTHDLGAWKEIEKLPDFLVPAMARAFSESIPRSEEKPVPPVTHSFDPGQTEFAGNYERLVENYGPGKGYMLWNIADMFASKIGTEAGEKWAKLYQEIEASTHV